MDNLANVADIASPPDSLYYVYGDPEQYYSESQSPSSSGYDMAASDLSNFPSTHPSPTPEDDESLDPNQDQKQPAAKRKRENRYKNAPPAVLSRRRAQNRASQRAYRERKDQRIKDLEQMLDDAKQRNDVLSQAYAALHTEYVTLKSSSHDQASYSPHHLDLTYGGGPAGMGGMGGGGVDGGLEMDMYGVGVYDAGGAGGLHGGYGY